MARLKQVRRREREHRSGSPQPRDGEQPCRKAQAPVGGLPDVGSKMHAENLVRRSRVHRVDRRRWRLQETKRSLRGDDGPTSVANRRRGKPSGRSDTTEAEGELRVAVRKAGVRAHLDGGTNQDGKAGTADPRPCLVCCGQFQPFERRKSGNSGHDADGGWGRYLRRGDKTLEQAHVRQRYEEHHQDGGGHEHSRDPAGDARSGSARYRWHLTWADWTCRDEAKRLPQPCLKYIVVQVRHGSSFRSLANAWWRFDLTVPGLQARSRAISASERSW
jgi:hypothetical protein